MTPELPFGALPSWRLGIWPLRPRTSVMPWRVKASWVTAVIETGVFSSEVECRVAVTITSWKVLLPLSGAGAAACGACTGLLATSGPDGSVCWAVALAAMAQQALAMARVVLLRL
ncbi:hypothetical protein GCM10007387_20560 [Pseudoduganella albidiflava]|uniref:Uncharacterized protein n=1 Tax=Pseudoduganella albidiflava TaxID=321983 RepID=A0AA87XSB2_9BURK|nr:hypothetical protein GCM10007387_20560 [Pseudoduganella albidiflava]